MRFRVRVRKLERLAIITQALVMLAAGLILLHEFLLYSEVRSDSHQAVVHQIDTSFISFFILFMIAGVLTTAHTAWRVHQIRHLYERSLDEKESLYRRSDSFRDTFLGILGHDLRNPLHAVLSGIVMLQGQIEDPQQKRILNVMVRSSRRMGQMIDQILSFAQTRLGGGIPIKRAEGDAIPIIRRAVDEIRMIYPSQDIVMETAEDFCMGLWDADRLAQIVSNLVANAVVHGTRREPVHVRISTDNSNLLIEVHNEGEPIDPSLFPYIFDPFRCTKHGPRHTGLGLFITQQTVLAFGGDVTVRSVPSEGTTFKVRLPLKGGDIPEQKWSSSTMLPPTDMVAPRPDQHH